MVKIDPKNAHRCFLQTSLIDIDWNEYTPEELEKMYNDFPNPPNKYSSQMLTLTTEQQKRVEHWHSYTNYPWENKLQCKKCLNYYSVPKPKNYVDKSFKCRLCFMDNYYTPTHDTVKECFMNPKISYTEQDTKNRSTDVAV